MPDRDTRSFFLLSSFAEFYEAVADIKLAIQEGRLPLMLRVGDDPPPATAAEIAAMVSGRLAGVLDRQEARVERDIHPGMRKAYRTAAYSMAALADELFVLELDWTGREAWLEVLLEYKRFKSRMAGQQVFSIIRGLLDLGTHDALHLDLAAVLLMVLQLGFKGQYRGGHGEAELRALRLRLFALLRHGDARARIELAFPQAYRNLVTSSAPARLAPLTPWYLAAAFALALYLIVSTLVWLRLVQPFLDVIAGS